MRKIRFRGKRKYIGEWVFGDFEYNHSKNIARIHTYDEDGNYERQYEVKSKTIGQFTGLYDKTRKEIYEGDIVKFRVLDDTIGEDVWKEYTCEVSFYNGCFCTHGTPLIQGKWKGHDMVNVEIIGNIHDNPELLKGDAE